MPDVLIASGSVPGPGLTGIMELPDDYDPTTKCYFFRWRKVCANGSVGDWVSSQFGANCDAPPPESTFRFYNGTLGDGISTGWKIGPISTIQVPGFSSPSIGPGEQTLGTFTPFTGAINNIGYEKLNDDTPTVIYVLVNGNRTYCENVTDTGSMTIPSNTYNPGDNVQLIIEYGSC